jgi:hypothetical protein
MAGIHKPNSQYYKTPIKNFYLDIARFRTVEPSSNDVLVTIAPKYENRPDLFSHAVYGTPSLWWVLVLRNMDVLIDPIEDFKAGTEIWVPTPENAGGGE